MSASSAPPPPGRIEERYLLALNVRIVRTPDGTFHADPSWAKDLLRHLGYIAHLTYLTPARSVDRAPDGFVPLPRDRLRIISFGDTGRRLSAWLSIPVLFARLLIEVPRARIVHSCIAGYPIPAGWLAIPLARLFRRRTVVIVESAFWRATPGERPSFPARLKSRLWEAINRFCLRQADYAAYSQEEWRRSLPAPRAGGGVLFQASWIDADAIVPEAEAEAMWRDRRAADRSPRFLFAARLVPEKGTAVLAAAIERMAAAGRTARIDIIGNGPDRDLLARVARGSGGAVRMLEAVPYGEAFFTLLRGYDAVLVPSLSDEQPRIVYDAYSQAIPAIGSDSPGLAACIRDGETGRLVKAGSAAALADLLPAVDVDQLRAWGMAGRRFATLHTHDRMHMDRLRDLQALL